MRLLLFICFLAGYAVKSEDSNYYVIQIPVEDPPVLRHRQPLQVYWNVPTMQCTSKKIPFQNLERFGIIQNTNDSFRGDQIAILYDPGFFPALLLNETSGSLRFRNGGVPQEGDLEAHLKDFQIFLEQSIPDKEFSGIGIIDFESWRPILRQNFGDVYPYKSISYDIERSRHWWWPNAWIQAEAKKRFEESARLFMQNTIALAKQLRPKARWGYYGFPYCFNMASTMQEDCSSAVRSENDQIDWLWMESTALYPSVYSSKNLSSSQLRQLIAGRVREAARERRKNTLILPYFWFRYRDGSYLNMVDLKTALETFNQSKADGFIIWGSSNDVNTPEKCKKLLYYIENYMGPEIARFTKYNIKQFDEDANENSTLNNSGESLVSSTESNNNITTVTDTSLYVTNNIDNPVEENDNDTANANDFNYLLNKNLTDDLTNDNKLMESYDVLIDLLFNLSNTESGDASNITTENVLNTTDDSTTETVDYLETIINIPKNMMSEDISEEYLEDLIDYVSTNNPLEKTTLGTEYSTSRPITDDQTGSPRISTFRPNKDIMKGQRRHNNEFNINVDNNFSTTSDQYYLSTDVDVTLSTADSSPKISTSTTLSTTTMNNNVENATDNYHTSEKSTNTEITSTLPTEQNTLAIQAEILNNKTHISKTTISSSLEAIPKTVASTSDSSIIEFSSEEGLTTTTIRNIVEDNNSAQSTLTNYSIADIDDEKTTTNSETTTQQVSKDEKKGLYNLKNTNVDVDEMGIKSDEALRSIDEILVGRQIITTETIPTVQRIVNDRTTRSEKDTISVVKQLSFDKEESEYVKPEDSFEDIVGDEIFSNPTVDQVLVHMV